MCVLSAYEEEKKEREVREGGRLLLSPDQSSFLEEMAILIASPQSRSFAHNFIWKINISTK